MAVRAVQAVLGAASCALLGIAGRRFLSERVGLFAAGLLAVYPFAIFSDGIIQKSSVDAFLVTAMLASLAIFMARPHWRWMIAAGLSAGAFAINRETGRLLYPVVVAWLLAYFPSRPMRTRLAWSAVFTVSPRRCSPSGHTQLPRERRPAPLDITGGPNFYIGNNPGATGSTNRSSPAAAAPNASETMRSGWPKRRRPSIVARRGRASSGGPSRNPWPSRAAGCA